MTAENLEELRDEVACVQKTLLRLADPFCQKHHISADRRNVNVVVSAVAFDFVKMFAARITLGRTARFQNLPEMFNCATLVCSWILDP